MVKFIKKIIARILIVSLIITMNGAVTLAESISDVVAESVSNEKERASSKHYNDIASISDIEGNVDNQGVFEEEQEEDNMSTESEISDDGENDVKDEDESYTEDDIDGTSIDTSTSSDIEEFNEDLATKSDMEKFQDNLATVSDIVKFDGELATKSHILDIQLIVASKSKVMKATDSQLFGAANNSINPKSTIMFGNYKQVTAGTTDPITWKVLTVDTDNNKALLWADKVLDGVFRYGPSFRWVSSDLRTFCNNTFYNEAFNADEKGAICATELVDDGISNPDNYVFVLSREELLAYNYTSQAFL